MFKKLLLITIAAVLVAGTVYAQAAPTDDQAPPVVVKSSWGRIKALYRSGAGEQAPEATQNGVQKPGVGQLNARDLRSGPFPCGEWYSRVLWEARNALSRRADGSSSSPIYDGAGKLKGFWGDWDYVNSDPYALQKAKEEAFGYIGGLGPANGHYRGGWCTFFARLVLYRSTYWSGCWRDGAYWHLTMPAFPGGVYSWCNDGSMTQNYGSAKPGWLVLSGNYPHTAILEARAWDFGGWGWWVIDSNWVGGNGGYYIAKHFMLDSTLRANNFWAWNPTWATTN